MELYITIAIIAVGVFLFIREYFSIDTTSLLIMAMFIVAGVLSPEEGFSGFVHPATITLACMFVVSAAIFKTGIIDGLSGRIIRLAKINYIFALVVFCLVTAVFSAFINDTAVVAIMIPMALLVCKETGINPSKLLIPISFAACFGGAATLVGTGTNILISGYAEQSGLEGFGMFEFSKAALVLGGIGFLYVFLIAPFLLPKRDMRNNGSLAREAERYIAEITLLSGDDVNRTVSRSKLVRDYDAQVLIVLRNSERMDRISSDFVLRAGDVMKVMISPGGLSRLEGAKNYAVSGSKEIPEGLSAMQAGKAEDESREEKEERRIYEVMIPFGSELAGESLRGLGFRNRFRSSVLAIRHRNETIMQHISDVVLREGDMMLVYTTDTDLHKLTSQKLVVALSEYEKKRVDYKRVVPALLIAAGVVTAAALNITSILMSSMIGSLLLIMTSTLKPDEAYKAVDWKVVFMLAGVLSMGHALEKTGGSEIASQFVLQTMGSYDSRITLSAVFLVTWLSTTILSSRAAAALMTPIVISLASAMQVSERPLLVAVIFACAFTFMTPLSNPTNTMVYTPGNYRFNDYLKVGTPLNIIIWIAASFVIPYFFPF